LHEALENNFDWICPENLFSELSEPKSDHKGSSKTYLDAIQCLVEKTSAMDLNASFDNTWFPLSEPSSKAVKKSTLGSLLSTFSFIWVLEVITTIITAPYPFYFVVVPRITSNLREVRFGEVAVVKQILVLHRKDSWKFSE
jgi:hypothetical protein